MLYQNAVKFWFFKIICLSLLKIEVLAIWNTNERIYTS